MKQYLPLKPTNRGFKTWVIADSTNGYSLDMQVYTGREGTVTEYGLGERVVLELTEQYRGRGHRVFCDNYFTSPALFNELKRHQLYACGTIRQNRRGLPADLQSTRLPRGESRFWQNGQLVLAAWQDKRQVHILSTLSQLGECDSVTRRERDGSQVSLSCPTAILTYTKYMGGVDLGDQLRKYYCVRLKCNKNYKYIFWCMFDCCITNAFILSKFCTSPSSSGGISVERLKQFRVALAWSLIGGYNTRQRAGRPRSSISRQPTSSTPSHFPTHHMRKRCVYCHTLRSPPRRRESVWKCSSCVGEPTLCMTGNDDGSDCWRLWHTTT